MPKKSVQKPFTVLVMVIIMIMLGAVSVMRMQMDLLPEISLPYILVITTYPGASPEKVEAEVCEPMESALSTITGVKNVYSISSENYGLVELEFEDDLNMDSILVKVSTAVDSVKSNLPDTCGTPQLLEIGTDMLATQYLAVGFDGMESDELSAFVESTVIPELERQDGVANVTATGMIEKSLQVELNEEKVDEINNKILAKADKAFAEAYEQLEDAKKQLEDGEKELKNGKNELNKSQAELDKAKNELEDNRKKLESEADATYSQLAQASAALEGLQSYQAELLSQTASLQAVKAAIEAIEEQLPSDAKIAEMRDGLAQAQAGLEELNNGISRLEEGIAGLETTIGQINSTAEMISSGTGALTAEELEALDAVKQIMTAAGTDTTMFDMLVASGNREMISQALLGVSAGMQTQLDSLKSQLAELKAQRKELKKTIKTLQDAIAAVDSALLLLEQYKTEKTGLELEIQVTQAIVAQYEEQLKALGISYEDIEAAKMKAAAGFGSADAQIAAGKAQLESAQSQLDSAKETLESSSDQIKDGWDSYNEAVENFEKQKEETLKNANLDQLLTIQTLAGLIYAQDFSMPAGYIEDADHKSWLVKIGEHYDSVEELEDLVLVHIDEIGDITLGDVADLTIIDNSATTYGKLNGKRAVILSVYKASTAGTNAVSRTCVKAINKLEKAHEGLDILVMMDQGDYITLILSSVLQSMILGAVLAIVILAIFLKDFLPTIVVAISIPLSVLTALIAMYFSGISLNMLSMSGMALGIGMLVDNSIVVIENIYRLRNRGMEAPRAAVQGTKQVAGAIISSTLTTVCVFFPMVYSTGLVRQLMMPMSLTIIFCLMSSLLIAMTVVPAASSTLLRRTRVKEHKFFDKVQDVYGRILAFFLKVKIIPIGLAVGLLALSIFATVRMGIVLIPDMTADQIQGSLTLPEELTREECYGYADELMEAILTVEGVDSVGVMSGSGTSIVGALAATEEGYSSFTYMVTPEENYSGSTAVKRICADITKYAEDIPGEFSISSGMSEMTTMLGSGLSITIAGNDLEQLREIGRDFMEIIEGVEGFTDVTDGQEAADQVLHIYVDKNKAMGMGLSVAQIYQEIAGAMTTSAEATSVTIDGSTMTINVVNELDTVNKDNIMDYLFEVDSTDEDGNAVKEEHKLGEFASMQTEDGFETVNRKNQTRYITVSAAAADGYNTTLLSRELEPLLAQYDMPDGYSYSLGGEYDTVLTMITDMVLVMGLGLVLVYLVMVAQFQSLLSPFIILFTVPLAFTGGLLALWATGENLSMIALMGLLVLMGTVVNNGIVFVDYTNQLRIGGMERHDALIATGKTRMRPILMTALTTILAESSLIFGDNMGAQMGRGMALVIAGGLAYATLMTLFVIPVMYDILFRKKPMNVDVGTEDLDDAIDDAAEFMLEMKEKEMQSE